MQIISLADIEIRKRQRAEIATAPLNELRESIRTSGLLHPPVFWLDTTTNKWVLTVGERRTRAIEGLAKDKVEFFCAGERITPGNIPITPLGDYLDEIGRFEAELAENVFRVDLDWRERAQAYSDLHIMRKTANPKQTVTDTGREIADKTGKFESPKSGARVVADSLLIAQHLHNPKIAGARNAGEAVQLILKQEEEALTAALTKRSLAKVTERQPIEVRHGDLNELFPQIDSNTVDLICADPPYGISAGSGGFSARTVHHHDYEDTIDTAKDVARCILTEGFRVTKPRANMFIFCDIELFDWLKVQAANMGWIPFRRPLIWIKSDSEGLAPWGSAGPRITTEFIFYATKGRRGLNASPVDVLRVNRVSRHERIHAAEKPIELMTQLIKCATLPGDLVLDPCCGSGSTLVAAREAGRNAIGFEKDKDYFNTALTNITRQKEDAS